MLAFLKRLFTGRSKQLEEIKQSIFALNLAVERLLTQQENFERKFDMSQERFDEQMAQLNKAISNIDTAAKQESVELSALKEVFETEIKGLKDQLAQQTGSPVDTSALDDAVARLGQSAENVANIVPAQQSEPEQIATSESAEEANTEETTATSEQE